MIGPLGRSGGIGRRVGLKHRCPQGRVGSTPTSGTSECEHEISEAACQTGRLDLIVGALSDTTHPARASRFTRLLAAFAVPAIAMSACGGSAPGSPSGVTAPVATERGSTAEPSATEEPIAFTSNVYPYSLVLPGEASAFGVWERAAVEWTDR